MTRVSARSGDSPLGSCSERPGPSLGEDEGMHSTVEICKAPVVGSFTVPEGPGPFPGVVALSGSGGGAPGWWGELLAPHGIAVLAAAYFGVEPLPTALCEIPVETVAASSAWLRGRSEIRDGRVGLVGGSKGAELALLAATAYPESFGPVAAIAPQSVTWFGVDLIGEVADASARSSWTLEGQPVPFVPPALPRVRPRRCAALASRPGTAHALRQRRHGGSARCSARSRPAGCRQTPPRRRLTLPATRRSLGRSEMIFWDIQCTCR